MNRFLAKPCSTASIFLGSQTMSSLASSAKDFFIFDEVSSTMDKARELAPGNKDVPVFAVLAEHQTKGRGTRGRDWVSSSHNMYLTLSIQLKALPIPWLLVPLRVGTLIQPHIQARIGDATAALKWPNDILISGKKVCGVLIEVEGDRMLIGIGCNVCSAPIVNSLNNMGSNESLSSSSENPEERFRNVGRPSTCIADHSETIRNFYSLSSSARIGSIPPHHTLAADIFNSVKDWCASLSDSREAVIRDFNVLMDKAPQKLRPDSFSSYVKTSMLNVAGAAAAASVPEKEVVYDPIEATKDTLTSPVVVPLGVDFDGALKVRMVSNNEEVTLVADYLW